MAKSSERLQYIAVDDVRDTGGDFRITVQLDGGGAGVTIPRDATVEKITYYLRTLAIELETSAGERAEKKAQ